MLDQLNSIFFHPVTLTFLLLAAAMVALIWVLSNVKTGDNRTNFGVWMRQNYWKAMLGFGLALGAGAVIFYLAEIAFVVIGLVDRLGVAIEDPDTDPGDLSDFATSIAILLGALAAAATLIFQLVRVWINERQTTTAEQAHITELINKAVEGLGAEKEVNRLGRWINYTDKLGREYDEFEWKDEPDILPTGAAHNRVGDWQNYALTVPNIEVRIGAIYSLERIAQDSDRDHVQIMEILCSYIRENSDVRDAKQFDATIDISDQEIETSEDFRVWAQNLRPRSDIQTAIQVLGRRTETQIKIEMSDKRYLNGFKPDLSETNLQGIDFRGGRFPSTDISKSKLQGALFRNCKLNGSHLSGCEMEGAVFHNCDLSNAYMVECKLDYTQHFGGTLQNAKLGGSSFENAKFHRTELSGASLKFANLSGADFQTSELVGCNLEMVKVSGSTMFLGANLKYSILKLNEPKQVLLSFDQTQSMFADGSVLMPENVEFPNHWISNRLTRGEFFLYSRSWQKTQGYDPD